MGNQNERCTTYFGNLPYDSTEEELIEFLHPRKTKRITIPIDKETERPRGFAFVEFENEETAQAAVKELDGAEFGGRTLKVNIAKPRESRPRGGGDRRERR